ncbi:MAG TPA: hypothetical protein VJ300_07860 [Thermoplasmata archaeon]|nr:hypothetical protein [Thermoplasmata archaeon]
MMHPDNAAGMFSVVEPEFPRGLSLALLGVLLVLFGIALGIAELANPTTFGIRYNQVGSVAASLVGLVLEAIGAGPLAGMPTRRAVRTQIGNGR